MKTINEIRRGRIGNNRKMNSNGMYWTPQGAGAAAGPGGNSVDAAVVHGAKHVVRGFLAKRRAKKAAEARAAAQAAKKTPGRNQAEKPAHGNDTKPTKPQPK